MVRDPQRELLSALLRAGRLLDQAGFCLATDGNFSARLDSQTILLTRSGIEKRGLDETSFVPVPLSDAKPPQGSSEWPLHRAIYRARAEVMCILHVHSPFLTTYAAARRVPPPMLLAESHMAIGEMAAVPFCPPGTPEVGESALKAGPQAMVYLLANHGAVALGSSVDDALHRLERAEFLARVAWQCEALGGGLPLTAQQLSEVPPC